MRRNPDALAFALCWIVLAVVAGLLAGSAAGLVLSVGVLVIALPASALILQRTGSFALERKVRWSILAVAVLLLFVWAAIDAAY